MAQQNWRRVGYAFDDYKRWGSFEACATIAEKVRKHLRAEGDDLSATTTDELLTFLCFSAQWEPNRADETPEQDRVLLELQRRPDYLPTRDRGGDEAVVADAMAVDHLDLARRAFQPDGSVDVYDYDGKLIAHEPAKPRSNEPKDD